jgi:predicted nuclease of predicted toxin-antitoxin system
VPRLFADENFPLPVVEVLRTLGHDVLTIHEAGRSGNGVDDEAVLDEAIAEQRAVITLNRRHFIQLHHRRSNHAGVVVCTSDRNFTAQGQRIHDPETGFLSLRASITTVTSPMRRPLMSSK